MNSTQITTAIGIAKAVFGGALDYLMHNPMEGGALKQPTFWIGLILAALFGLQGYYTQGVHQPAAQPAQPAQPEAPKA